jgi:hypothetical protein
MGCVKLYEPGIYRARTYLQGHEVVDKLLAEFKVKYKVRQAMIEG